MSLLLDKYAAAVERLRADGCDVVCAMVKDDNVMTSFLSEKDIIGDTGPYQLQEDFVAFICEAQSIRQRLGIHAELLDNYLSELIVEP